jgi:photosystem II stability/assembly factor-like uncharacterized protein
MKLTILLFVLLSTALNGHSQSYWNSINSGTQKKLLSISFGNNTVGYISGADSLLLKSNDGGLSWNALVQTGLDFSASSKDIVNINFVDANTGYVVVSNFENPQYQGALYKTVDGGQSWVAQAPGNIAAYRSFFFDENNGYLVGSAFFAGHVVTKLSAGTWGNYFNFNYNPDAFLYAIDFRNSATGIIGGSDGYVYRTFNGGTSWDTVKTVTDSIINSIIFLDDSTILAATDNSSCAMLLSLDTGRTWAFDMSSATFAYPVMKSVVRSPKDYFISVGYSWNNNQTGVIYRAANGSVLTSSATQPLYEVTMRDDSVAFAVGDSGLIISNYKFLLGIEGTGNTPSVVNVYPNPSSGIFTIETKNRHTVSVYDLTGRLVLTDNTPSVKRTIDLGKQAKGIYEIEIKGEADIVFQKLVLQ